MALRYLLSRVNHTSSVHTHLIKPKIGLWSPINHNLLNPNCCCSSSSSLHESSSGSQIEAPFGGISIYKGAQKDDWIINLAQFAVHTQNEKENKQLEFVRVVGASHTMVSSIMYHITLEAIDAKKHKIYHAVVWMQLLKQFMELLVWNSVDDHLSAVGVKRGDLKLHEAVMFHMNKTKREWQVASLLNLEAFLMRLKWEHETLCDYTLLRLFNPSRLWNPSCSFGWVRGSLRI